MIDAPLMVHHMFELMASTTDSSKLNLQLNRSIDVFYSKHSINISHTASTRWNEYKTQGLKKESNKKDFKLNKQETKVVCKFFMLYALTFNALNRSVFAANVDA